MARGISTKCHENAIIVNLYNDKGDHTSCGVLLSAAGKILGRIINIA